MLSVIVPVPSCFMSYVELISKPVSLSKSLIICGDKNILLNVFVYVSASLL